MYIKYNNIACYINYQTWNIKFYESKVEDDDRKTGKGAHVLA